MMLTIKKDSGQSQTYKKKWKKEISPTKWLWLRDTLVDRLSQWRTNLWLSLGRALSQTILRIWAFHSWPLLARLHFPLNHWLPVQIIVDKEETTNQSPLRLKHCATHNYCRRADRSISKHQTWSVRGKMAFSFHWMSQFQSLCLEPIVRSSQS